MITTYENKTLAFYALQYGWKPSSRAYRIKDYRMRLVKDISPSSLLRLRYLVDNSASYHSATGENWYKITWEYVK